MGEVLGAVDGAQPSGRLLTVGIPVFNGRSLLRSCLQSVIDSTLPRERFEIVIADDGSTEPETLAILEEFRLLLTADPGFFRVVTLETNSGGAARPRNRILEAATGDYVFFVDADDTIGTEALERIGAAVTTTPADWIAVHQVPVNGRAAVARVRTPETEVPRTKALTTLTVHKVFRRAEIERQQLLFDEGLPSGQDVSFAFSFILNAQRFLMLGGYDYYYLTQHADNPNEPTHLSRRARTPEALIDKNERILGSMLTVLRTSPVPEAERREIVSQIVLPRVLVRQNYLKSIIKAGPVVGTRALRRLSKLLADPLVTDLTPAELNGVTVEQLRKIAKSDWAGLARLVIPGAAAPGSPVGAAARVVRRGRRLFDLASGRASRQRVVDELRSVRRTVNKLQKELLARDDAALIRQAVADLQKGQRRLEANLQAEFQLRDMLVTNGASQPAAAAVTPLNPGWQLSSQAVQEIVRHILLDQPSVVVECGCGASTMWIARALQRAGQGRLISLENLDDWVEIVTGMLQYEGLGTAEVRHAPLVPFTSGDTEQPWYTTSVLDDVEKIDLLIVDGPPGNTSKLARYPALPALRDKLRPGATVMLDDCHRWAEKETVRRWVEEVPGLTLVHQVDRIAILKLN